MFDLTGDPRTFNAMKTIALTVTGRVQGVWFRASAKEEAERLGITGFVCNQPDGTVYMEATGTEKQIKDLVNWCREGPRHARVDQVDTKEIGYTLFDSFIIRR